MVGWGVPMHYWVQPSRSWGSDNCIPLNLAINSKHFTLESNNFPRFGAILLKKKNRFSLFFHRINRKPNRKNLWISSLYVTWFSWVTWGFSHSFFYDKNPFEKNPFPQIWRNSLQLKFFISPNLGKFPQIWGQPDWLPTEGLPKKFQLNWLRNGWDIGSDQQSWL